MSGKTDRKTIKLMTVAHAISQKTISIESEWAMIAKLQHDEDIMHGIWKCPTFTGQVAFIVGLNQKLLSCYIEYQQWQPYYTTAMRKFNIWRTKKQDKKRPPDHDKRSLRAPDAHPNSHVCHHDNVRTRPHNWPVVAYCILIRAWDSLNHCQHGSCHVLKHLQKTRQALDKFMCAATG